VDLGQVFESSLLICTVKEDNLVPAIYPEFPKMKKYSRGQQLGLLILAGIILLYLWLRTYFTF